MDTDTVVTTMWTGINSSTFSGVLDNVKSALPIIIPVIVGLLAIRKGWSFVKSQIKGA